MSNVFLGMPSQKIANVIYKRKQWDMFSKSLENFNENMIGNKLPAVGSTLTTKYDIAADGNSINMPWQVLGYNSSIPRYVKYKDQSGNKIYISSMKAASNDNVQGYLLSAIVENDPVYVKNANGEYVVNGQAIDQNGVSQETFTYGQTNEAWGTLSTDNGSYSVPSKISVDSNEYVFAGYNMTLATAGTIGAVKDGIYYNQADFKSSSNYYTNDWSGSQIRAWLNGNNEVDLSQQMWKYYDDDYNMQAQTTGNIIPKFTTRFGADNSFLDNVMQIVNRTWVWGTSTWNTLWNQKVLDDNKCEHVSDKFWLLGFGHVNSANSQYRKDWSYDTTHYSTVFGSTASDNSRNERKRYQMNVDGSMSAVARDWRLHSAHSGTTDEDNSKFVGIVNVGRGVNSYSARDTRTGALLPACTIG